VISLDSGRSISWVMVSFTARSTGSSSIVQLVSALPRARRPGPPRAGAP
jgi:hypothetical protein